MSTEPVLPQADAPASPPARRPDAPPAPQPSNIQPAAAVRPDLAAARNFADQSPQDRFLDARDGPQRERIGDRQLSEAEYDKLTYSEKHAYAERRTELAEAEKQRKAEGRDDPAKPAADEAKVKVGDIEVTESELRGLMERKALEESRKLARPADPSGYKAELPKDFVAPQGIEFRFDEASDGLRLAREFAHANNFDQEQFKAMLSIHAAQQVQETANLKMARDAEVMKLGATGNQRVTAIQTFLRGHLGDELAAPFETTLVMANQVKGWEVIMGKLANGFSASRFSAGSRSNDDAQPRLSEAQYAAMSYGEKKAYAESATRANSGKDRRS